MFCKSGSWHGNLALPGVASYTVPAFPPSFPPWYFLSIYIMLHCRPGTEHAGHETRHKPCVVGLTQRQGDRHESVSQTGDCEKT